MSARRFSRQLRILQAADFERVFKDPGRRSDKYFTLLFHSNDLDYARLGLAISKKKIKRAVDRNRIKRLIRESFRLYASELGANDIVVMARESSIKASNSELFQALENLWKRIQP